VIRGIIVKSFLIVVLCIIVEESFASGNQNSAGQLHQAVIAGDTSLIEKLLSEGVDVDSRNGLNWTPLHTAIRNNQKAVVDLLVSNNANVNAKDRNGQTPLHFAIESGQKEVIASLLSKSADVNAADNDGETPLMLANMAGQSAIAETLRSAGATEAAQQTSSTGGSQPGQASRGESFGRAAGEVEGQDSRAVQNRRHAGRFAPIHLNKFHEAKQPVVEKGQEQGQASRADSIRCLAVILPVEATGVQIPLQISG